MTLRERLIRLFDMSVIITSEGRIRMASRCSSCMIGGVVGCMKGFTYNLYTRDLWRTS